MSGRQTEPLAARRVDPRVVVGIARTWIGTPYVHQASEKGVGSDCLGLIRGIWREIHGHEPWTLPVYSSNYGLDDRLEVLDLALRQYLICADRQNDFNAGRVILFRMNNRMIAYHLGLYVDRSSNTFVHTYSKYGVVESSLSTSWKSKIFATYDFPNYC